jgi:zinc-ribbon domain
MNPEISRRCSSCGAAIRERDALFCTECGKPLPTKRSVESEKSPARAQMDEALPGPDSDEVANAASLGETIKATEANGVIKATNHSQRDSPVTQIAQTSEAEEKPQKSESPTAAGAKPESPAQTESSEAKHSQSQVSSVHPRMEKTRETLHRASTVAREVIEDEVKRVEKIRHVSSVVLEEASYDPSLRFVLVALGLFILFIILLVVSKVMG